MTETKQQSVLKYLDTYFNKRWSIVYDPETGCDCIVDINNKDWVIILKPSDSCYYKRSIFKEISELYDIHLFDTEIIIQRWIEKLLGRIIDDVAWRGNEYDDFIRGVIKNGVIKSKDSLNENLNSIDIETSIKKYFDLTLKKNWTILSDPDSGIEWVVDFKKKSWIVKIRLDGNCTFNAKTIIEIKDLYDIEWEFVKKILKEWVNNIFKREVKTMNGAFNCSLYDNLFLVGQLLNHKLINKKSNITESLDSQNLTKVIEQFVKTLIGNNIMLFSSVRIHGGNYFTIRKNEILLKPKLLSKIESVFGKIDNIENILNTAITNIIKNIIKEASTKDFDYETLCSKEGYNPFDHMSHMEHSILMASPNALINGRRSYFRNEKIESFQDFLKNNIPNLENLTPIIVDLHDYNLLYESTKIIKEDINKEESIKKYLNVFLEKKWSIIRDPLHESDFIIDIKNKKWIATLTKSGNCSYGYWLANEISDLYDIDMSNVASIMKKWIKEVLNRRVTNIFCINLNDDYEIEKILNRVIKKDIKSKNMKNEQMKDVFKKNVDAAFSQSSANSSAPSSDVFAANNKLQNELKDSETKEATGAGSAGGFSGPLLSVSDKTETKEEKIKGGLSSNMTLNDIAKKHKISPLLLRIELIKGIKIENEHTTDEEIAKEIAMDHLVEDPTYYDKLKKVETKEATGASSSGQYSGPSFLAKSMSKKDWRGASKPQMKGGKFVKVKSKCNKFPYCNQGDIKAVKIFENQTLKNIITTIAKKHNISENVIKHAIMEEINRLRTI